MEMNANSYRQLIVEFIKCSCQTFVNFTRITPNDQTAMNKGVITYYSNEFVGWFFGSEVSSEECEFFRAWRNDNRHIFEVDLLHRKDSYRRVNSSFDFNSIVQICFILYLQE